MAGWDDSIFGNLPPQIDWNAPSQPTLPSDPFHAPGYSVPAKLMSYLNQRFVQPAWRAATLPGDIATGKTTMADPEAQQRVMSGAAQLSLGPAGGAPESAFATGWAPSAWRYFDLLKQRFPERADMVDNLANNFTPNEARQTSFDPLLDSIKNGALKVHNDDLTLAHNAAQGVHGAGQWLRAYRGQPPDPFASRVARASQPYNTFELQQPDMPPFPANDPRSVPPPATPSPWPPPGMTLNSPPPDQGFI